MCRYVVTFVCRYVLTFVCRYILTCVCRYILKLCVPFYASVSRCNACRYCVSVPARLRIIVHTQFDFTLTLSVEMFVGRRDNQRERFVYFSEIHLHITVGLVSV